MARARTSETSSSEGESKAQTARTPVWKRIAWVALAGAFVFVVASLLGFNVGDWPSHAVTPHNDPVANWCGSVGAFLAYSLYYVLGPGVWVGIALILAYLVATLSGYRVWHFPVRIAGAMLIVLSFSSLLYLALPTVGPFPEGNGGLLAIAGTQALVDRFNVLGSTLIILLILTVGMIVAVDELVVALPVFALRSIGILKKVPVKAASKSTAGAFGRLMASAISNSRRPGEDDSLAGDSDGLAKGSRDVPVRMHGREAAGAGIDPDAGGLGAVRSFNDDESRPLESISASKAEERMKRKKRKRGAAEVDAEVNPEQDEGINPVAVASREVNMDALREKISKLPVNIASRKSKEQAEGVKGAGVAAAAEANLPRSADYSEYRFPPIEQLEDPEYSFNEKMEDFVREQATVLENALQTYGIDGEVVGIDSGPVITLYEVQLAPGTKVSSINSISSDIARALRAQNIRVVPNMAGKTTVGIEVPNLHKEKVRIKELMTIAPEASKMKLPMFLGKDASGTPLIADLTAMPHMLIAGTTGSGKSVCMNTIIMSFLFTKRPDELKLILVDPKMVEMSQFRDIPHLMCPVVTEMSKAAAILEWAVTKMEERYELLAEVGVRDISTFNAMEWEEIKERLGELSEEEEARFPKKLPYIVFMIDELADLIMTNKEVETSIVRIAQKARAVGIHLILATQRPQANVVTGLIKSNMPCRVSFKVSSGMDSRIVLDHKGAELLLGQGDMLFLSPRSSELIRAQGTLVDDMEIRKVVRFLKDVAEPSFERQLIQLRSPSAEPVTEEERMANQERDPLFIEAVRIIVESQRGSVSLLQRRLAIGYTRASRLIEQMAEAGIIGSHKGSVAREVLVSPEEWDQMRQMLEAEDGQGTLFGAANEGGDEDSDSDDATLDDDSTPAAMSVSASSSEDKDQDDGDQYEDDDTDTDDDIDEVEYEYEDEGNDPIASEEDGVYDDDGDDDQNDGEYEYEYVYEDEEDEEARA